MELPGPRVGLRRKKLWNEQQRGGQDFSDAKQTQLGRFRENSEESNRQSCLLLRGHLDLRWRRLETRTHVDLMLDHKKAERVASPHEITSYRGKKTTFKTV